MKKTNECGSESSRLECVSFYFFPDGSYEVYYNGSALRRYGAFIRANVNRIERLFDSLQFCDRGSVCLFAGDGTELVFAYTKDKEVDVFDPFN